MRREGSTSCIYETTYSSLICFDINLKSNFLSHSSFCFRALFAMKEFVNLALFFLISIAQAINPFEGGFVREKCLTGRRLTGCSQTLLDAYKNTNLSKDDQNLNDANTYLMLFTRNNKKKPEYLDECGGSLAKNTYFNKAWKTVMIVHGFVDSVCKIAWMREMMIQLLFRDNYNVILVDWAWGNQVDYHDGARNTKVVGKQMAFTVANIVKLTNMSTDNIHIIGHSLGSHIAGVAGLYTEKLTEKKIGRITGLDPAGPAFQNTSDENMLDKTDAKFVDVIHSNAGKCLPFSLGHLKALGHLDFYVNGGSQQLSCIPNIMHSFLKGDIFYAANALLPAACFHVQSIQYYKVSINPCQCQFIGIKCNSWEDFKAGKCKSCGTDGSNCAVMGMDAEYYPWKEGNNVYYLNTITTCPYCDNKGINLGGFPLLPPGREKPKCYSTKTSIFPDIIG